MRKNQLRQEANIYLHTNRRGPYRHRLHRRFVIHKVINDLFVIKDIPPKWHALNQIQMQKLVVFWQKKHISPITIMKYMTIIRAFMHDSNHDLIGIDNQSLGLSRKRPILKKITISSDVLQKISNPIARVLLGLQIHFGLTISEAMRLLDDVNVQQHLIWVTRDIASNSTDRHIPILTTQQKQILREYKALLENKDNLIAAQGYDVVRHAYRKTLASLKLPLRQSYRYLYAQLRYEQLSSTMSTSELNLLIMREMGLKSPVTLWGYLHK